MDLLKAIEFCSPMLSTQSFGNRSLGWVFFKRFMMLRFTVFPSPGVAVSVCLLCVLCVSVHRPAAGLCFRTS